MKDRVPYVIICFALIATFVGCRYKTHYYNHSVCGYDINIIFKASHPFLAEYERYIKITRKGNTIIDDNLGYDSGGYCYINILKDKDHLYIHSYAPFLYRINMSDSNVKKLHFATNEQNKGHQIYQNKLDDLEFVGQYLLSGSKIIYIDSKEMNRPKIEMLHGG